LRGFTESLTTIGVQLSTAEYVKIEIRTVSRPRLPKHELRDGFTDGEVFNAETVCDLSTHLDIEKEMNTRRRPAKAFFPQLDLIDWVDNYVADIQPPLSNAHDRQRRPDTNPPEGTTKPFTTLLYEARSRAHVVMISGNMSTELIRVSLARTLDWILLS
jgi:hypothetical protein